MSAHEKVYGIAPDIFEYLRTFGEVAMVNEGKKIKGKLINRGIPCLFVGYAEDHSPNVYKFLNLETEQIILSRNYLWLNKSYGEYKNLKVIYVPEGNIEKTKETEEFEFLELEDLEGFDNIITVNDKPDEEEFIIVEEQTYELPDEEEEEIKQNSTEETSVETEEEKEENITQSRLDGVNRALKKLQTWFNPDPWEHMNDSTSMAMIDTGEKLMVANIYDGNPEPKSVQEASRTKDWEKWWTAMSTEFKNMEEKQVWEIVERKNVPTGRKIIGNKWVFTVKDDGRYRARTVAKGYSQIPGKDFQENFAPVINDTTFHLLVLKVLMNLKAGQFDIETAFLYGELEEELWMTIPEGYDEYVLSKYKMEIDTTTHCLKLKKSIYGLVQAARQWWKKFKEVMKAIGYHPSEIDPCLFIKDKGQNKKSFVIIYVDDGAIFGSDEDIKETISALRNAFNVKDMGTLEHFVGCHLIKENESRMYLHQPKLLKHLSDEFKYLSSSFGPREYRTPAAPKSTVVRPTQDDPLINKSEQAKYRSGVGMLLYLVKHSRPEIANAVRELSKVGDGALPAHWKALMRTIKYVLQTSNLGLKIEPNKSEEEYTLEGVTDSEYAGDKDTRISVYGFVIYFCGSPIAWKSKSGKTVTLSSTEAEYYGISECAKELIFVKHIIESMGIKIKLPIKIKVDNVGAIYISNNNTTGQRTKHIDVRVHFVRQYIEDGIFKIEFVKSDENDADIFTKNTTEEIFVKQSSKLVGNIETKH